MRLFGHPLHAIVVSFPIALLTMALVWDALAFLEIVPSAAVAAYHAELAGLAFAGLAALTGLAELVRRELSEPIRFRALYHAGAALGAASCFLLAFALRRSAGETALPTLAVLGLEALGGATLGATGYLGGDLVFRHGVGVEPAARATRD